MKYYTFLKYLFAGFIVPSLLCACNEDETGAGNWAGFQEGGYVNVKFSYDDKEVEQKINIVNKGGGASTVQLTVFSSEELAMYNAQYNTDYELMPQGSYTLPELSLSFTNEEKVKEIGFKIHTSKLFDAIRQDKEDKLYVLPLKITGQSIANSNSTAIYVMSMEYPILSLAEGETSIEVTEEEKELTLKAYTYEKKGDAQPIPNKGDIELGLKIPDNATNWLQAYNDTSSVKYQLLPASTYEFSKLTGVKGEKECAATMKIHQELLSDGAYILPIQLSGVDKYVALEHGIRAVKISKLNDDEEDLEEE